MVAVLVPKSKSIFCPQHSLQASGVALVFKPSTFAVLYLWLLTVLPLFLRIVHSLVGFVFALTALSHLPPVAATPA